MPRRIDPRSFVFEAAAALYFRVSSPQLGVSDFKRSLISHISVQNLPTGASIDQLSTTDDRQ
jgi:hypothetical protein